jgi:hypothetical protein
MYRALSDTAVVFHSVTVQAVNKPRPFRLLYMGILKDHAPAETSLANANNMSSNK